MKKKKPRKRTDQEMHNVAFHVRLNELQRMITDLRWELKVFKDKVLETFPQLAPETEGICS